MQYKHFKLNDGFADIPLRLGLGTIFVAHGAQKLFGWFGGYGLEATGQWMASIGLVPGYLMALAAGSVEFFGGIFILLGLLTRLSALGAAITMLVAIFGVHFEQGFFMANNGYEFALALLLMAVALILSGSGRLSIDAMLFRREAIS
jgi:putative oxidoreductase